MTEEQRTELNYLLDIVLEASKWRMTDDRDCIRMEVEHRINVLTGRQDPDDEDLEQAEPENQTEHLSSKDKSKRKWAKNRVRVVIDGKPTWKLRSECHKEVMPGWTTKLHWVWDGPSGDEEPAVDKLGDELWNEHEKGE